MDISKTKRILIRHDLSISSPDEDVRRVLQAASYSDEEIDTALVLFAMPDAADKKSTKTAEKSQKEVAAAIPHRAVEVEEPAQAEAVTVSPPPKAPRKKWQGLFTRKKKKTASLPTASGLIPPPSHTKKVAAPPKSHMRAGLPVSPPPLSVTQAVTPLAPQAVSQKSMDSGASKIFHSSESLNTAEIQKLLGIDVRVNTEFKVTEIAHGYLSHLQIFLIWFFAVVFASAGVLYYMYTEEMGIFHESAGPTPFDHYLPER